MNLVTSCEPCNQGKGAVKLTDDSAVQKRRAQAEDLQGRREQIEMMAEWQNGLIDLDAQAVATAAAYFERLTSYSFNDDGLADLRTWVVSHGLERVMSEMRRLAAKCLRVEDGKVTKESVEFTARAIHNTFKYADLRAKDPVLSDLLYLRGIIRNRYPWCPDRCLFVLQNAQRSGVSIDDLRATVFQNRSFRAFEDDVAELVKDAMRGR